MGSALIASDTCIVAAGLAGLGKGAGDEHTAVLLAPVKVSETASLSPTPHVVLEVPASLQLLG